MVRMNSLLALLLISPLLGEVSSKKADDNQWKKDARKEWQEYARKQCPVGTTEKEVENKMTGRYMAKIHWPYNSGLKYQVIYRVDDVTELIFDFSNDKVLATPATVITPRVWVRNSHDGKARYLMEKDKIKK